GATARQSDALLAPDQKRLSGLVEELRRTRTALARLSSARPDTVGAQEAWVKHFETLEEQKETLEARLTRQSEAYRLFLRAVRGGPDQVRVALPADAVLVDYLIYRPLKLPGGGRSFSLGESRVLAFIVRPDREPACVPLGRLAPVEEAVRGWRREV